MTMPPTPLFPDRDPRRPRVPRSMARVRVAADLAGLSEDAVRAAVARGDLGTSRIEGELFVDLDAALALGAGGPDDPLPGG